MKECELLKRFESELRDSSFFFFFHENKTFFPQHCIISEVKHFLTTYFKTSIITIIKCLNKFKIFQKRRVLCVEIENRRSR